MNYEFINLYSDFLGASFTKTSATSFSEISNSQISHDKVTNFLRNEKFDSRSLWKIAKPLVRMVESDEGVLIADDSISEKPYTDENEIICWHYDHSKGRSVKGINLVSLLYYSKNISVPIGCEIVSKKAMKEDPKTGKMRRKSDTTKNQLFQSMLKTAKNQNQIRFRLVLSDVWYASSENMVFIKKKIMKDFIFPLKSNRKIALSLNDVKQKNWISISDMTLPEKKAITIYLEGVDFPLQVTKQIFKNENSNDGVLYLVCSIGNSKFDFITTEYQKRWKVEEYHKSLKQNLLLEKSPTKIVRTQTNHLFLTLFAFIRWQRIFLKQFKSHFALKAELYHSAVRESFQKFLAIQALCT